VSQSPRLPGIARRQNDFVVADRHTFQEVTEAYSGQQRPSWNTLSLSPRQTVVVTQQYVPPLSHRHQPLVSRGDIEKKRARGERRMFGKSPGNSRRRSRGKQRERRRRQMPPQLYRIPLICSALG
jgi:hypothetical protein